METDHYVININRLKILANQVKTLDLLNPTSHTIMIIGEILDRCKGLPELEIVDFQKNNFKIDNIEADA
tara:strand:- start:248 stop:454 length:207 start_codon:yes stop_codon:yes gene_type:complete